MYMTGKYAFLSNYFVCDVYYDGIIYNSAETAFQLQKFPLNKRKEYCKLNPWEVKPLGRKAIINVKEWGAKKDKIMFEIVKCKFKQHPELAEKLINVKEPLIEHNDWNDTYWGICNGKGQNKLGNILTEVRQYCILDKAMQSILKDFNYPLNQGYVKLFIKNLKDYYTKNYPEYMPTINYTEENIPSLIVQFPTSVDCIKVSLGGV